MFKNCIIKSVGVNSDDYHAAKGVRGERSFVMSPSALKAGDTCWERWRDGYNPPESAAKDFGNLLDCLLLTADQFKSRYAVIPSDAPKKPSKSQLNAKKPSPETLTAIQWWSDFGRAHPNCKIVTAAEFFDAESAVKKMLSKPDIEDFITASDKQVHLTGEWHDEATKLIIPVECLVDLLPRADTKFFKAAGDVKSSMSGAIKAFSSLAEKYKYHSQAGFDLDMIIAAEERAPDNERNTWCLAGVESYFPFQPFKRMYDATMEDGLVQYGRNFYRRALSKYAMCLKTGKWFDYDNDPDNDPKINVAQGWTIMRPPKWMAFDEMEKALSFQVEAELAESEPIGNDLYATA